MEHIAIQLTYKRVPLPTKNERGTKQDTHVQAIYAKAESQLDWPETQSATTLRNARRKEGRTGKEVVGGGRNESRLL